MGRLRDSLNVGIEEAIIVFLIILNVLEFMQILPGDLDFVKKIISWTALGYLLYKAKLSELFFGEQHTGFDIALIFTYFLLILKNFVLFSKEAVEHSAAIFGPLAKFILYHAAQFEMFTFLLGGVMLILLSFIHLVTHVDVKSPSILAMFHEEGESTSGLDRILRSLLTLFILSAFYLVVFNLVMEWLAWAIDSSLLVLGIFFYLFFFIRYSKTFHAETILYKIGTVGEEFYEKFIELFKDIRTLYLGVAGMLVLHLLTDVGNFILPYLIGKEISYFGTLGPNHEVLWRLLADNLHVAVSMLDKIGLVLVYVFNVIAILFLLLGPAYIWYRVSRSKHVKFSATFIGLFFGSVISFIMAPVFFVDRINVSGIVGVDIMTKGLEGYSVTWIGIASLVVFVLFILLSRIMSVRRITNIITITGIEIFFAYYIFIYSTEMIMYYYTTFMNHGLANPFLGFWMILFLAITALFYIGGFAVFMVKSWLA